MDVASVLTHGEPHPGNIIHTATGLALIDWDTVAIARPERDLWMIADADADADATLVARYRDLTPITLEREALVAIRRAVRTFGGTPADLGRTRRPSIWRGSRLLLAAKPSGILVPRDGRA